MSMPFVMRRGIRRKSPKLKKKDKGKSMFDACVIELWRDSNDSKLCLVGH